MTTEIALVAPQQDLNVPVVNKLAPKKLAPSSCAKQLAPHNS